MSENFNQSTAESQNLYTEEASGEYLPDGDIDNDFDVEASVEAIDKEEAEKDEPEEKEEPEEEPEEEDEPEEEEPEEKPEAEESEEEPEAEEPEEEADEPEEAGEEESAEEAPAEEESADAPEAEGEAADDGESSDNAEEADGAEGGDTEGEASEGESEETESEDSSDDESEEEDADVPDAAPALVIEPTETDEEQSERVLATQTLIQALESYTAVLEGVETMTPAMEAYLKAGFEHLDRKYGTKLVASTEDSAIKKVLDVTRKTVKTVGNEIWILIQKIIEFVKEIYRSFVNDVDALQKENSRMLSTIQRLESYTGPMPTTRIKRPRALSVGGKFQQTPELLKKACIYVVEKHTDDIIDIFDKIDGGVNALIQKPEQFDHTLVELGKAVADRVLKGLGAHNEVYPGDIKFVPNAKKGDLKTQPIKDIILAASIRLDVDKKARIDDGKVKIDSDPTDLVKGIGTLGECLKVMAKMEDSSRKIADAAKDLGQSVKELNNVAKETGNEHSHELATITNVIRTIGLTLKLDRSSGVAYCFKTIKVYQAYYNYIIKQYETAVNKGGKK